jgi:hypothetical protein
MTGEALALRVRDLDVRCDSPRRVQEAIRFLRAERMPIASGPEGYWIETDPEVLRLTLVSHKRRIARSAEAVRWLDPALYDRLTLALDLSTEEA